MFFIEKSWEIIKSGSQATRFTIGITIGFGKDLVGVPPKNFVGKKNQDIEKMEQKNKNPSPLFFLTY